MLLLSLENTDPFFNLAADEYLLKNKKENYFILGINGPSVIIGKHQVAHREADTRYVTENNIPVIRRISGGGAVYHDFGNLNFSFIFQSVSGRQVDFRKYTEPIVEFLSSVGIKAQFEGKNDLKVNGLKISGNAEHVFRERVLHHGTLLFDSHLESLKGSLRKNNSAYSTRAVESNPSPVMNLKDKISNTDSIEEFRNLMLQYFLGQKENSSINLTLHEITEIDSLVESKYRTWEWNYAYGPEYQFNNKFIINNKGCSCRIFVKDGIILECEIAGSPELSIAAKELIGCRHMVNDLSGILLKGKILKSESDIYNFF